MNSHSQIQRTLPFLLSDLSRVIRSRVHALLPGGIPTLARSLSLMWRWPCLQDNVDVLSRTAIHMPWQQQTAGKKKSAASNLVPMLGRGPPVRSQRRGDVTPACVCVWPSALIEMIFFKKRKKKKEMWLKMRLFLHLSGDLVARLLSVTCEQR